MNTNISSFMNFSINITHNHCCLSVCVFYRYYYVGCTDFMYDSIQILYIKIIIIYIVLDIPGFIIIIIMISSFAHIEKYVMQFNVIYINASSSRLRKLFVTYEGNT